MLLDSVFDSPSRPPRVAVIVAHPDDETLWAGGQILARPDWDWTIVTLCRGNDPDRAPKFRHALKRLNARGAMADLDDGPEQTPLSWPEVEHTILSLLCGTAFDALLTHGPWGEYTRHRRHEEVSRVVAGLWQTGRLTAGRLFLFAYEDAQRAYLPRPRANAHLVETLSQEIWQQKYDIITGLYGFAPDSWEARTTPRQEALWHFESPDALNKWIGSEEGSWR
ncbi:MAG: PIG-L deacetylase family protein [Phycisphaerae bacterium]